MRKTSIVFSNAVDNINKLTHDGEDITYLLDGRFVIEDFENKLTITDHKVFIF